MNKPQRIQLRRTKGWRMPPNTVKVDRSTPFGNPFPVVPCSGFWNVHCGAATLTFPTRRLAAESSVRLFRRYLENDGTQVGAIRDEGGAFVLQRAREELRGKNLACWCKPGEPCHADVLLELANKQEGCE
jgi:hypothetical protein